MLGMEGGYVRGYSHFYFSVKRLSESHDNFNKAKQSTDTPHDAWQIVEFEVFMSGKRQHSGGIGGGGRKHFHGAH